MGFPGIAKSGVDGGKEGRRGRRRTAGKLKILKGLVDLGEVVWSGGVFFWAFLDVSRQK